MSMAVLAGLSLLAGSFIASSRVGVNRYLPARGQEALTKVGKSLLEVLAPGRNSPLGAMAALRKVSHRNPKQLFGFGPSAQITKRKEECALAAIEVAARVAT